MSTRDDVAPSQRWAVLLAALGGALVAVFVAVAALTAVPPTVANLASVVSDGVEPTALDSATSTASVVVPTGWVVTRADADEIVALSPDGVLRVRIALIDGDPVDVVGDAGGDTGALRSETLASGLRVDHADLADGTIVAGVAVPPATVLAVSELLADVDPDAYRPAFAQVLEGIGP